VGNILNLFWNKDKSFGYGYCLIVLSKDRILTAKQKGIYAITEIGQLLSGFEVKGRTGEVAVIGPSRMNYASVIPAVRYTRNLVQELGEAW